MPREYAFPELMSFEESKELLGEWPESIHIKHWIDPKEDTIIYKQTGSLGDKPILGAIKKDVYMDADYEEIKECLMSIDETTTMRANAAGPIDTDELDRMGIKYELRTKNSYKTIDDKGRVSMIAQGNPIHSVMMGYKRGRFTGKIDKSGWSKANPEKNDILSRIPQINNIAYRELAPSYYKAQKRFAETYVEERFRIAGGIYTTLSANKYSNGGSTAMSYHIDSGDLPEGLTTIANFIDGDVTGCYFVLPRYGVAISRGDGDVFMGDSGEVHGVYDIEGSGTSMNCVCYCDTRLATLGVRGKPEKLIGKNAPKVETGSLEGFF